jgi:hypothetical protein
MIDMKVSTRWRGCSASLGNDDSLINRRSRDISPKDRPSGIQFGNLLVAINQILSCGSAYSFGDTPI